MSKVSAHRLQSINYFESKDKIQFSATYSARFQPSNSDRISYFLIEKIRVENYIQNINEYNRYLLINGTLYTLTSGFYPLVTDYVTHINAVIAASGVALSYNTVTKLLTISAAAPFSITTQDINNGVTLFTMMGFPNTNLLSGSNTYTGTEVAISQYTRYIDFASVNLSNYFESFISSKSVTPAHLARIYLSDKVAGSGEYLEGEFNAELKHRYESTKALGIVDVDIVDEFGLYLFGIKGRWSMVIVTYERSDTTIEFPQ